MSSKSGKKKTNPNKRPASQADVERARREGRLEGARFMAATYTMVLRDKKSDRFTQEDIFDTWVAVKKLWQEISEGRLNFSDILYTLKEENGITIGFN